MQITFLEKVWTGYEIQKWADSHNLKIMRVRFNRKGAIVYTMPK